MKQAGSRNISKVGQWKTTPQKEGGSCKLYTHAYTGAQGKKLKR